jgi:hypothetical protein
LNYAYSYGRTRFNNSFNKYGLGLLTSGTSTDGSTPTPSSAAQAQVLALIGSGLPTQVVQTDAIDASLLVPVAKSASIRFLLRHELGRYNDPHYDGVDANRVPYVTANPGVFLDSGPQDYKVTSVGVLLQYTW